MRCRRTLVTILTLTFATAVRSEAQFYQDLSYPLSAEANAMGGAGAALVSDDPLATALNPAQLGLFSLRGIMSAGVVPSLDVSPSYFREFDGWYLIGMSRDLAINLGIPLNRFWHSLPFKLGVGIAYSNSRYPFGHAVGGLEVPTRADYMNDISLGIGVKYLVNLGIGWTINPIASRYDRYPLSQTNWTTTHDLGAILEIPILQLVSRVASSPVPTSVGLRPVFNLTFGYSARNLGSHSYFGGAGLPEEADLGWNIELGLKTRVQNHQWKWVSFTFVREADASLISLDSTLSIQSSSPSDSVFNYSYAKRKGFGGFQVYKNLIAGKPTELDGFTYGRPAGNIGVVKGAQIQLGQFIYLREGSVTEAGLPTYTTYGWGAKLDGLVKTLLFMHCISPGNEIAKLLLDHFNLEFDYSKANGGPFDGEPFESLNFAVK